MEIEELLEYCRKSIAENKNLVFEHEIFDSITEEQAYAVAKEFAANTFMLLPRQEINFFEWLKINDYAVWKDLWEEDSLDPYFVGVALLPALAKKDGRGFPICDLVSVENYFFAEIHLPGEEANILIETAKNRFMEKKPLTIPHLLVLEISMGAIDIWRFAYKHGLSLADAKAAVDTLVEDKALVHITQAEYLASFVEL